MTVKLLTKHHLEFLSLKGGCSGSSESTLVKMPHCWIFRALAHFIYEFMKYFFYLRDIRLRQGFGESRTLYPASGNATDKDISQIVDQPMAPREKCNETQLNSCGFQRETDVPPHHTRSNWTYSKTCVKRPLSGRAKNGFQNQLFLNAGQKYCRMPQWEHSAIL